MKTIEEIDAGIAELKKQLNNPLLPRGVKNDITKSIQLLQWVKE